MEKTKKKLTLNPIESELNALKIGDAIDADGDIDLWRARMHRFNKKGEKKFRTEKLSPVKLKITRTA